jgi:uncharacterized protein
VTRFAGSFTSARAEVARGAGDPSIGPDVGAYGDASAVRARCAPAGECPVKSARVSRRTVLKGGLAGLALWMAGPRRARGATPVLTFGPIPASTDDLLHVPADYRAQVLYAWGDPIQPGGPAWLADASQTAVEQTLQAGMHHDGMHLFRVPDRAGNFLLAVNHEYTDEGILHAAGGPWTAEKVAKSKAAHGVSVVEIAPHADGTWSLVRSPHARRITADTPMRFSGPAASSPLLVSRTRDGDDAPALGTIGNCAAGQTPWDTYLTCEENVQHYFVRTAGRTSLREAIYGIGVGNPGLYRWDAFDPRFRVEERPNECNRFGWVVEIDPFRADSTPVKRTALGRFRHESAFVRAEVGKPVAVYMGDDEEGQHLYKFVSAGVLDEDARKNRDLLDTGTLYVARMHDARRGSWIALEHGKNGLDAAAGFAGPADVLVFARHAARTVGATPLDRPEWIAMDPRGRVFVSLTYGAANPYGLVLSIDEEGDASAVEFRHGVFARGGPRLAIDGSATNASHPGLGAPDGLHCDSRGVLWIETDFDDRAGLGNNQIVAVDPETLEAKRFLVGPRGCEITGFAMTPDLRTLFVNVQHPGEARGRFNDPARPARHGSWPTGDGRTRPRSATVAIRRADRGEIGT